MTFEEKRKSQIAECIDLIQKYGKDGVILFNEEKGIPGYATARCCKCFTGIRYIPNSDGVMTLAYRYNDSDIWEEKPSRVYTMVSLSLAEMRHLITGEPINGGEGVICYGGRDLVAERWREMYGDN